MVTFILKAQGPLLFRQQRCDSLTLSMGSKLTNITFFSHCKIQNASKNWLFVIVRQGGLCKKFNSTWGVAPESQTGNHYFIILTNFKRCFIFFKSSDWLDLTGREKARGVSRVMLLVKGKKCNYSQGLRRETDVLSWVVSGIDRCGTSGVARVALATPEICLATPSTTPKILFVLWHTFTHWNQFYTY